MYKGKNYWKEDGGINTGGRAILFEQAWTAFLETTLECVTEQKSPSNWCELH